MRGKGEMADDTELETLLDPEKGCQSKEAKSAVDRLAKGHNSSSTPTALSAASNSSVHNFVPPDPPNMPTTAKAAAGPGGKIMRLCLTWPI
jgi:hypothetical protein